MGGTSSSTASSTTTTTSTTASTTTTATAPAAPAASKFPPAQANTAAQWGTSTTSTHQPAPAPAPTQQISKAAAVAAASSTTSVMNSSSTNSSSFNAPANESLLKSLLCPGGHGLYPAVTEPGNAVHCTVCTNAIRPGLGILTCPRCRYNACSLCCNGPTQRRVAKCKNSDKGCPCYSWNGEADEACCFSCRNGTICKEKVHVIPSVPAKCANKTCLCHARGGRDGGAAFCSTDCRDSKGSCNDSRTHCLPTVPFTGDVAIPARCAQKGCPCESYSGLPGHYCSRTCMRGNPCKARTHTYPAARCANSSKGCPCFAQDDEYCSDACKVGTICREMRHPRPDHPAVISAGEGFERKVMSEFQNHWDDPNRKAPTVAKIVALRSSAWIERRFWEYVRRLQTLRGDANIRYMYHGTVSSARCTLFSTSQLCSEPDCGVCGITKFGFDPARIGKGVQSLKFAGKSVTDPNAIGFRRFGSAICATSSVKKANDYSNDWQAENGKRRSCMLVLRVAAGTMYIAAQDMPTLTEPPAGYDSVYGITKKHPQATSKTMLNYDELCAYDPTAISVAAVVYYDFA